MSNNAEAEDEPPRGVCDDTDSSVNIMRRDSHLSLVPFRFFARALPAASSWRSPARRVLIVGAGALARATADDVEDVEGRSVVGHLSWDHERVHAKLRAPLLGSYGDLARCLSTHDVAEVYIAGTAQQHGEAIGDVARVCEQFGVAFAVPAIGFRLTRARPRHGQIAADGYVHFAIPKPSRAAQEIATGLRQLTRMAEILWMSMMVLLACVGIRPLSATSIVSASMD